MKITFVFTQIMTEKANGYGVHHLMEFLETIQDLMDTYTIKKGALDPFYPTICHIVLNGLLINRQVRVKQSRSCSMKLPTDLVSSPELLVPKTQGIFGMKC